MSFSDLEKKLKAKPEPKIEKIQTGILPVRSNIDVSDNIMYEISKKRIEPKQIYGDKDMDKEEIINWFKSFISKNQKQFTLDWLRGQKLSFECVNEMRKNK